MKKQILYILGIVMTLQMGVNTQIMSATRTWNGSVNNSWYTSGNWNGGVIADSTDIVVINSNAPNNLTLTQNHQIAGFAINGDTLDLGGYILTVTGTCTFSGGKTTTGVIKPIGTLCHFGGGVIDSRIEANCGYYHMNGGSFMKPTILVSTGSASTTGTGNCIFSDSLTITHSGNYYFSMGTSYGDIFQTFTITNHSSHEVYIGSSDSTFIEGNLILNNTSIGGIVTGVTGGVTYLASGKTISIGSSGFTNNYLTLKNFYQLGSTAQALTLTGTAILNLINANFDGNLTVTSPGILLKSSTFNGTTSITRNGSSGNYHCDGGNNFIGAFSLDNSGNLGRVRFANTTPDNFYGDATFNSTGGQDVQIAYSGNNIFEGNLTINSNKVVFNTASGKVTFSGGNSQSLNGSYNYPFKKLAINKSSNHVTANTTLSVDDTLFFVSGKLITTSTNLLTMKAGSVASGASNGSFVSGPIKKTGNTAFQFPVGKNSIYRKVEITAPANATDAFIAEYFDTTQVLGSTMDTTISFISDCGYWNLSRTTGTSNITPKFGFDSTHCDYLTVKPVHISFWDGTKWVDKGEGVKDSNTKKTSSAVTSYGNFALAYKLVPGDAPQFPYPLTVSANCTPSELMFKEHEVWLSFQPDSAMLKFGIFNTDTSKVYSSIHQAKIYSQSLTNDSLDLVNEWSWPCDSLLNNSIIFTYNLDTAKTYLLNVSKFETGTCEGINDTTNYYLSVCVMNIRMQTTTVTHQYNNLSTLVGFLGNGTSGHMGTAMPYDIVMVHPNFPNLVLDFDDLVIYNECGTGIMNVIPPLIVGEHISLYGNYDLLSESPLNISISTSPNGTLIIYSHRGHIPQNSLLDDGYIFKMMPDSKIANLRLRGAMPGAQDYNQDRRLCAAIRMENFTTGTAGPYEIRNCEISNFSYAGVFADAATNGVIINNCFIHHIRGGGGYTTPKGYGSWFQGGDELNSIGTEFTISESIYDECKAAIDMQPNPINVTINSCSFLNYFTGEVINKHSYGGGNCPGLCQYTHPTWSGTCVYNDNHTNGSCSSTNEPVNSPYTIGGPSAGHTTITNSIFHKTGQLISLPFPANIYDSTSPTPLYNTIITNNTFKAAEDPAATYDIVCGYGGFARINDIYVKACTWDWERSHDIMNASVPASQAMLRDTPNSFSYAPGVGVSINTPQPPEVNLEYTGVDGYVPGYSSNTPKVAYVNLNTSFSIKVSHGTVGTQPTNVAYIIRAKASSGASLDENSSANNKYYDHQTITGVTGSDYTSTNSAIGLGTSKAGLYGIDALAVNGNSNSNYNSSQWVHKPIIVAPASDYKLIFNIKDSYFNELYGSCLSSTGVFKQVELNGHTIWREDIAEGGDDWEQVEIDLSGQYNNVDILSYIDPTKIKNTLTFSIAMDNPTSVNTGGPTGNILKGVNVYIDDVYLKKYGNPDNIIDDADVEHSMGSGLGLEPSSTCSWYSKNAGTFGSCTSLDDSKDTPTLIAETEAFLTSIERKSGHRAVNLRVHGIHANSCGTYPAITITNSTDAPTENEVISAAIDFDYRDFLGCGNYANMLQYVTFESLNNGSADVISSIAIQNKNIIISQDITITGTSTNTVQLKFEGCKVVFSDNLNNSPKIIVSNQYSELFINNDSSNASLLFACGNMWSGIQNNGGKVIIRPGSCSTCTTEIEDANIAIASDGGIVNIRYALFDHNYIGLDLKNGAFIVGGISGNDGLLGINFKCTDGKIAKYPHAGSSSYAHIQLTNVSAIQIGGIGSSPGGYTNTFTDAVYGVKSKNSNFDIINNNFENLIRGINYEYDFARYGTLNISTIGGDGNLKNTFKTVQTGIFAKNVCNTCELTVQGNEFDNSDLPLPTNQGRFYNSAITIQSVQSGIPASVEVFNNTILNNRIGIHALNIENIRIGGYDQNSNPRPNSINYNLGTSALNSFYHGIWMQNCNDADILANTISNDVPTTETILRGVVVENSDNANIGCNEIDNMGRAMQFEGFCLGNPGTQLLNNEMTDFEVGIQMETAQLSDQGTVGVPWDNEWINDVNNSATHNKVDGQLLQPTLITWYFQGTDGDDADIFVPFPRGANLIDPKDGQQPGTLQCANANRLGNFNRDLVFGPIVGDSANFEDYEEELKYAFRNYLYELLKQNDSLLTLGLSTDSSFQLFYSEMDTSNIGSFGAIRQAIDSNLVDSAATLNELVTDINSIEYSRKSINTVIINKILQGLDPDAADSTLLEYIFAQHWIVAGKAVYEAAAILGKEYHSSVISFRKSPTAVVETKKPEEIKLNIKIYPNPTSNHVTISIPESIKYVFELRDIYNRICIQKENIKELDVSTLTNGIYSVRILVSNKIQYSGKLVIIK